jgi:transcriptional regulator
MVAERPEAVMLLPHRQSVEFLTILAAIPFRGFQSNNSSLPYFALCLFIKCLVKISMMEPNQQRDLFPGALEMMILQTLKRKPLHGYALAQHIKQTSDDLLQVEEGSLYPALQRMLKAGWVKAEWSVSSTNRRVRVYRLTPAGRKHVQHEVSSFERMLKGITRVLALGEE